MSSNVSTPLLEPQGLHHGLTVPSSSPLARRATTAAARPSSPRRPQRPNMDDVPPLSLDVLTSRSDKVDALKLVADSIAQQRQRAARSLIFHPFLLAGLLAALAVAYQFAWARRAAPDRDWAVAMPLAAGVATAYLLAIRYATAGYLQLAEDLGWDWLVGPDTGDEDVVLGARFGNEIIGALVLRLEPSAAAAASPSRKKHRGQNSHHHLRGGKGVVRAWTTRLRYRGQGVGADLLHEAVRITRERCGRDAAVGFAAEHANSSMVLPETFNRTFRKGERRAAGALEKVLCDWEGARRKR